MSPLHQIQPFDLEKSQTVVVLIFQAVGQNERPWRHHGAANPKIRLAELDAPSQTQVMRDSGTKQRKKIRRSASLGDSSFYRKYALYERCTGLACMDHVIFLHVI